MQRGRRFSENVEPVKNKLVKRKFKNGGSPRVIRGRSSMKKIDRGIVCTICQDDVKQNNTVLQLDWGKTHLLHFHCLKEWIILKPECPSWRTDLYQLYNEKIVEEARNNNELFEDAPYLYAEDLIPMRRAKERLFEWINKYENQEKKDDDASLTILRRW